MKNNKGITLLLLTVTIIVIIIIMGITFTEGDKLVKEAKVEEYITNMISIKAKAKVYAEEINAMVWNDSNPNERRTTLYSEKYEGGDIKNTLNTQVNDLDPDVTSGGSYVAYLLPSTVLTNMGLSKISEDHNYVVVCSLDDYTKIDIIYKEGIKYNKKTCYSLFKLQKEFGE